MHRTTEVVYGGGAGAIRVNLPGECEQNWTVFGVRGKSNFVYLKFSILVGNPTRA